MNRRVFVTGLGVVHTAPLAGAQQAGKIYGIGVLQPGSRESGSPIAEAF
jgi:hypothetical protein